MATPKSVPAGTIKRSVTLDKRLDEKAHALVGDRGFSALVNTALATELQRRRIDDWLAEREAELGPIPDEALERAKRAIDQSARR
jgi:post-segregation antitoxin (ccd killing protein)